MVVWQGLELGADRDTSSSTCRWYFVEQVTGENIRGSA
jgi:hypothetical protein